MAITVRLASFIAAGCLALPLPAMAEAWRCDPYRAVVCSGSECQAGNTSVWLVLDFDARTYSRCDAKGCDAYELSVSPSGIFVNVFFQPGTLFKATHDGREYLEVTTSGLSTYSQFGRCTTQ